MIESGHCDRDQLASYIVRLFLQRTHPLRRYKMAVLRFDSGQLPPNGCGKLTNSLGFSEFKNFKADHATDTTPPTTNNSRKSNEKTAAHGTPPRATR